MQEQRKRDEVIERQEKKEKDDERRRMDLLLWVNYFWTIDFNSLPINFQDCQYYKQQNFGGYGASWEKYYNF